MTNNKENKEYEIYFDKHMYRICEGKGSEVISKWSKPHDFSHGDCEYMIFKKKKDNQLFVFSAGANSDWAGAKTNELLEKVQEWSDRYISEYIIDNID